MAHVRSLFFNEGPLTAIEDKAVKAYTLGRPSEVIWNITNRCNLLCDHCYMAADGHAKPDQLTDEETIEIIRQMGESKVPLLFLSGGEPMMRPNFWEMLDEARKYGIQVTISTNATLIDRDVAKRLKTAGVSYIATSLYGPDEFHDALVKVPGTRKRVVEAIKILREEGVGVAVKTAVSKDTWPFIYDLIQESKDLDAGLIYLCDLITSGRSEDGEDSRITAAQWRELADFILDDSIATIASGVKGLEYDIGAMPSFVPYVAERLVEKGYDISKTTERLKIMTACPVGKGHMNINSEGGIMPCQFAQDWTVGNIRDTTVQKAVEELFKLRHVPITGKCGECEYVGICYGCRTKAWHAEGDPMGEDPTCMLDPEFERSAELIRMASPCCAPGACG
ncbi:MAG: radical SAM protein [Coriobacteriia bacterium]|jgi:radical SAM protein with 4Fe4S-binding SPASM domain|nr:radical SAM protein [Coriobacteriia bacterium]